MREANATEDTKKPPPLIAPEWLMAYADGETGPDETSVIEAALSRDPEARRIVAGFAAERSLLAALPASDDGRADCAPCASPGDVPDDRVARANAPARLRSMPAGRSLLAVAAGFAAITVVGGAFSLGLSVGSVDAPDRPAAGLAALMGDLDQLAVALESLPNDEPIEWSIDEARMAGTIVPLVTYVDEAGNFCRTVQQSLRSAEMSSDVFVTACRRDSGEWQVVEWSVVGPTGVHL